MASLVPSRSPLISARTKAPALTAVLDVLGPHWDPTDIDTGESQAHRMLYAHLDPDQQVSYEVLLAAGALPEIPEDQP